jgi:hypothetical protein
MTVVTMSGDSGGDLATHTPVREPTAREDGGGSPERLSGSRFWVLHPDEDQDVGDDDGDKDGEEVGTQSVGVGDRSIAYLCRTPSPVSDADLTERSSELTRRHRKRITRRDGQRSAARAALVFNTCEGMISSPSLPLGIQQREPVCKKMPVLEPSVFFDDTTEGWSVIRRRRWSPASDVRAQDPKKEISKKHAVGLVGLRACANSRVRLGGPIWVKKRAAQAGCCIERCAS